MQVPGVAFKFSEAPSRRVGVETGVPLFLGRFDTGEVDLDDASSGFQSLTYTQWQRLDQAVPAWAEGQLGHAVRGFFENGGRRCILGRLADESGRSISIVDADAAVETHHDFDLLCAPDLATWHHRDVSDARAILSKICNRRIGCMALLDATETEIEAHSFPRDDHADNAALYAPWAKVSGARLLVPPSGHVAGVIARTDRQHGVHKPPANEVLHDVIDLGRHFSDIVLERHGEHVNFLRSFRGRGTRIWGARTLAGGSMSTRRVYLTVLRWLARFTQAVAFEPSDVRLWTRIHREVSAFLNGLFRRGALVGGSPAEAFSVKCDTDNNPPSVRQDGQVVIDVGLAIAQPTEFVVVRLVASTSGTTHEVLSPRT